MTIRLLSFHQVICSLLVCLFSLFYLSFPDLWDGKKKFLVNGLDVFTPLLSVICFPVTAIMTMCTYIYLY